MRPARQSKSKRAHGLRVVLAQGTRSGARSPRSIPPAGIGGLVVEAKASKGTETARVDGLPPLPPGGIVGVIGPNGAGKTTLFRMIAGTEKPDSGSLRLGETVVIAYVDQSREALEGSRNVWEEISGGEDLLDVGPRSMPSRAYVAAFGLGGGAQKPVRNIWAASGPSPFGEDAQVEATCSSDEPNNDRTWKIAWLENAISISRVRHGDQPRRGPQRIATPCRVGRRRRGLFEGNFQDYELNATRDWARPRPAAPPQYKKLVSEWDVA